MTPDHKSMIGIVCDASGRIGYGHFKRCLALGRLYQNAGKTIVFLMREVSTPVAETVGKYQMVAKSFPDHDAVFSWLFVHKDQMALVIVDHYQIDAAQEKQLKDISHVMVIDDLCRPHWCDYLVDQTLGRKESDYRNKLLAFDTHLFLGADYALIDPVYQGIQTIGSHQDVLISFGATDPKSATLKVIEILERETDFSRVVFHIPLSSLSADIDLIRRKIEKTFLDIRLYVDLPDLADLYAKCGTAIAAPGVGLLERIFCGLDNITITTADNQEAIAENFARYGATISMGEIECLDPAFLIRSLQRVLNEEGFQARLKQCAQNLVDGRGAARIVRQVGL